MWSLIQCSKLEELVVKYHENKMAHAFLLETNDQNACFQDVLEIVKQINCPHEYTDECKETCNLCNLVDLNALPSLIAIEAEGSTIKKEQILDLQDRFLSVPIYTKNHIYIIKNAEKLNASAANTMLKFLEEPNPNIIGFFLTDNKENIITTIRSRCEIVSAHYDQEDITQFFQMDAETFRTMSDLALEYIKTLENDSSYSILKTKKIAESLPERNDMEKFFSLLLQIYYNALHLRIDSSYSCFSFPYEILNQSSIVILEKKIFVIKNALEMIPFNVNIELLLDHFALEMRDCNAG